MGKCKKSWKILEHFKDNFLGKFKKYFVHVVEGISENEYILEEDGSRTRKRIL